MSLSSLLRLRPHEKVSVVGCGGKTSLINVLAAENSALGVLVSPTTKIFLPGTQNALIHRGKAAILPRNLTHGVRYVGKLCKKSGKLCALPFHVLERLCRSCPLTLMEADGSQGLFCKGWLNNEPALPHFTTLTVGVLNIHALNMPINEHTVFRTELFCKLTGTRKGQLITKKTLAAMVCERDGMFKNSVGRKALFINGADTPDLQESAQELSECIRILYPHHSMDIFAGSLLHKSWYVV